MAIDAYQLVNAHVASTVANAPIDHGSIEALTVRSTKASAGQKLDPGLPRKGTRDAHPDAVREVLAQLANVALDGALVALDEGLGAGLEERAELLARGDRGGSRTRVAVARSFEESTEHTLDFRAVSGAELVGRGVGSPGDRQDQRGGQNTASDMREVHCAQYSGWPVQYQMAPGPESRRVIIGSRLTYEIGLIAVFEKGVIEPADATKGFVKHDRGGAREVEAPDRARSRYAVDLVGVAVEDLSGKSRGLLAEHERIARAQVGIEVALRAVGAQEPHARRRILEHEGAKVRMDAQCHKVPVVYARTPYGALVDPEPEPPAQVQVRLRCSAEAGDVARVLRDLGLDEHHMEGRGKRRDTKLAWHGSGRIPSSENMRGILIAASLTGTMTFMAWPAAADPGDLALNRLTFFNAAQPTAMNPEPPPDYQFRGGCGTPETNGAQCEADNQLFANLINQLGGALAPSLAAPARTIGYGGFYFSTELSIANINGDAEYWRRGTVGTARDLEAGRGTATVRERVPNQLFVSRFHVSKGFPYGFELGLQASYLHDSSMVAVGLDIRWALFEGFRTGVGYLPDFAVRGSVNTLVGNPQLYLTVVGIDASLSKPFTIGGMQTLTPYLGGQGLMIFGDSTVIDGTPTRSSFEECPRRQLVAETDPMSGAVTGSHLECQGGSGTPMGWANDSRNEMVFQPVRILRWRGFAGLRYRFGMFTLTGEFAMDLLDRANWLSEPPAGAGRPNAQGTRQNITLDPYRQFMVTVGLGVTFN